jgi:hypothetical protein
MYNVYILAGNVFLVVVEAFRAPCTAFASVCENYIRSRMYLRDRLPFVRNGATQTAPPPVTLFGSNKTINKNQE